MVRFERKAKGKGNLVDIDLKVGMTRSAKNDKNDQ